MHETQTQRIARLGNPQHIWNGQSDFWLPVVFPVLEHVVIPGRTTLVCAACGKPLAENARWGALALADVVVVCHNSLADYGLFHTGCAPQGIPWVHEIGRRREAELPLFGGEL